MQQASEETRSAVQRIVLWVIVAVIIAGGIGVGLLRHHASTSQNAATTQSKPVAQMTPAKPTTSTPTVSQTGAAPKTLVNTGPGNVVVVSVLSAAVAAIGHYVYTQMRIRTLARVRIRITKRL